MQSKGRKSSRLPAQVSSSWDPGSEVRRRPVGKSKLTVIRFPSRLLAAAGSKVHETGPVTQDDPVFHASGLPVSGCRALRSDDYPRRDASVQAGAGRAERRERAPGTDAPCSCRIPRVAEKGNRHADPRSTEPAGCRLRRVGRTDGRNRRHTRSLPVPRGSSGPTGPPATPHLPNERHRDRVSPAASSAAVYRLGESCPEECHEE